MSSDNRDGGSVHSAGETGEPTHAHRTRDELLAQIEFLREQNQRLRDSYTRAKQTQYQRTALGLAALGILGVVGGLLLPGVRDVLFVLGATGLFGGLLTYYLTPEQFVSADVGRSVYSAVADDRAVITDELGLTERYVYVPLGDANARVRLFVPQHEEFELPDDTDLTNAHVVGAAHTERGVTFRPIGGILFEDFVETLSGTLGDTPATLVPQLTDALVEQFGLVSQTRVDLDAENGRLTVGVSDSVYGPADRIDHPIASFIAVGLARGLGEPVTVKARKAEDERDDYQITCRWGESAVGSVSDW